MAIIKTAKPKPNMNKEYLIDIVPTSDGQISIYDISAYLEPYNGRMRENKIGSAHHEIHGKTATVYIIDSHQIVDRAKAIKLAERFINGDFDTYRLD